MQKGILLLLIITLVVNTCWGLPYAFRQDELPDQYMTHPPDHDHTGHEDHTMDHGGGDHSGHGMKMWFHASVHNTILFEKWHTMEWWELLLSCVAVGVMGCLYEGLKTFREYLIKKTSKRAIITPSEKDGAYNSTTMVIEQDVPMPPPSMLSTGHIIQSVMHFLQLFVSYSLMLVFMTYSVYLCLSLCIGGAVGYFLFAYKRSYVSDNEHCN